MTRLLELPPDPAVTAALEPVVQWTQRTPGSWLWVADVPGYQLGAHAYGWAIHEVRGEWYGRCVASGACGGLPRSRAEREQRQATARERCEAAYRELLRASDVGRNANSPPR